MLILARKKEQSVWLKIPGYDASVKVVRIEGDKVWLGFEADDEINIVREELLTTSPRKIERAAS